MKKLTLHIKDMICSRCETVIRLEIEKLGGRVIRMQPGYTTVEVPTSVEAGLIAEQLLPHGFELLQKPEQQLVGQIKAAVRAYLQHQESISHQAKLLTLSDFITQTIGRNYSHLSKLFSRHEGHTVEHYYIHLRIERVKELLDYQELNVGEIALRLGYSSGHYLSAQFKRVTGMSISDYRKNAKTLGRQYFNRL